MESDVILFNGMTIWNVDPYTIALLSKTHLIRYYDHY